jgi:hypothetical protein
MLTNAARLCEANFGTLTLNEGNTFRVVALHNTPEAFAELRRLQATVHFGPRHPLARQIATKQVLHIADSAVGSLRGLISALRLLTPQVSTLRFLLKSPSRPGAKGLRCLTLLCQAARKWLLRGVLELWSGGPKKRFRHANRF